jgi:hypothetical protein
MSNLQLAVDSDADADTTPAKQDGAIKTPRPDITIGLSDSAIAEELLKRGLRKSQANNLLTDLQREQRMFSDPTQHFLPVRFPIMVVEGKAYATGRTLFEAQNQAVVSGSCMINLFQQFDTIISRFLPDSSEDTKDGKRTDRKKKKKDKKDDKEDEEVHLAFLICTDGPTIEFWVHYSVLEEGVCVHYMNLLESRNGSLKDGLEALFLQFEYVMTWYRDAYLPKIADQLAALARRIAH